MNQYREEREDFRLQKPFQAIRYLWIPPRSHFFAHKFKNIKKNLGNFHVYFFNLCSKCSEVSKLSGKTPYKKTQLKTLITFDREMVLTSNLVHIFIMSKDMC